MPKRTTPTQNKSSLLSGDSPCFIPYAIDVAEGLLYTPIKKWSSTVLSDVGEDQKLKLICQQTVHIRVRGKELAFLLGK